MTGAFIACTFMVRLKVHFTCTSPLPFHLTSMPVPTFLRISKVEKETTSSTLSLFITKVLKMPRGTDKTSNSYKPGVLFCGT